MVFIKGMRLQSTDDDFLTGAVLSGQSLSVTADDAGKDSELIVIYVTSLDVRRSWMARCLPFEPKEDVFMLEPAEALTRRVRREIRFKPGQRPFLHSGLARTRRFIRLRPIGSDQYVLRGLVGTLIAEGYRQIAP